MSTTKKEGDEMPEHNYQQQLSTMEHKLDLLLRINGLSVEQVEQIVEAKGAPAAQQALIEKLKVARSLAPEPATKPTV